MTGWSLRDVMKVAKISWLKTKFNRQWYVVNQNIKQGTILRKGEFLIVDLKTPLKQN